MIKNYLLTAALGTALLLPLTQSAQNCTCFDIGDGSDGAFNATANTTLPGGTYNYTSFNISSGVTVTVTGNQPLIIRCQNGVTIDGILDASGGNGTNGVTSNAAGTGGIGVAGGGNGGDGIYSDTLGPLPGSAGIGTGGSATQGDGWSGGGGGGYTTAGDSSGNAAGGYGGPQYGYNTIQDCAPGSGGGGGSGGYSCGSGGGGAGGGYIAINAGTSIIIGASGAIHADGGDGGSDGAGNCGGGGGGSGGAVWLACGGLTVDGLITAIGGSGGSSNVPGNPYYGTGANGADGRIRIDHTGLLAGNGTITPNAGYTQQVPSAISFFAFTPGDTLCILDPIIDLTINASPAGGMFAGTAVTGTNFDPSQATPGSWAVVTYTVDDSAGCIRIAYDSVYVANCVNGILQNKPNAFQLNVSPNPSNGNFQISLKGLQGNSNLRLMNALGQEINAWNITVSETTIPVDHLAPGIYLITAENKNSRMTRRIIVE